MCIISFYHYQNEFLLTHNRDESIDRSASIEVVKQTFNGKKYFSPIDNEKLGTWIFYSDDYVACILNGGKIKPDNPKSVYRKSRGIVLLELLKYNSAEEFCDNQDFNEIAPFTIFVYHRKKEETHLIFWNEKELEINNISDKSFVLRCSTTLYSFEKMNELENIFPKFKFNSPEDIFALHYQIKLQAGEVDPRKATTSITQIYGIDSEISMKYCPFF